MEEGKWSRKEHRPLSDFFVGSLPLARGGASRQRRQAARVEETCSAGPSQAPTEPAAASSEAVEELTAATVLARRDEPLEEQPTTSECLLPSFTGLQLVRFTRGDLFKAVARHLPAQPAPTGCDLEGDADADWLERRLLDSGCIRLDETRPAGFAVDLTNLLPESSSTPGDEPTVGRRRRAAMAVAAQCPEGGVPLRHLAYLVVCEADSLGTAAPGRPTHRCSLQTVLRPAAVRRLADDSAGLVGCPLLGRFGQSPTTPLTLADLIAFAIRRLDELPEDLLVASTS
ncbi:unnamed protein product [Protopolystoma xenopodis]|uniref:Uncharacterized protein n=1 Tax=Protopolystoma xenopodis TaxID=117903 RepID=A0A448XHW8_9PLAT|nr:unnamed protein product [Protopolystoma xenopodis]